MILQFQFLNACFWYNKILINHKQLNFTIIFFIEPFNLTNSTEWLSYQGSSRTPSPYILFLVEKGQIFYWTIIFVMITGCFWMSVRNFRKLILGSQQEKMSGTGTSKNHSFGTCSTGKILTENNPHQQSDFIMLLWEDGFLTRLIHSIL